MPLEFRCLHGHLLRVAEDPPSRQRLLCPLCGTISDVKCGSVAPAALAATLVPASISEGNQSGTWEALTESHVNADSEENLLPTSDMGRERLVSATAHEDHGPRRTAPPGLAGYEVMDELGRGGMGVVYRAYDERHGREVALKTLQRMSPDDLVRFKQEFRALADIAHPHLASLYELLSDGRTWCFTMEMLQGVELLDYIWSEFDALNRDPACPTASPPSKQPRLTRGRLHRLCHALKQLALGLHHLHQAGKLHSDIKPSNVIVTSEGRLVLLDFGLIAEISPDEHGQTPRVIQGTPHYMAPEQAACRPLTAASDWYAVGVMLYEVLTGRLPLVDKPTRIMLRKQYERPLEPRQRSPDVPPELNDLCMALLDLDPHRRPGAVEVLRAVDAEAEAQQILEASAPAVSVHLVGRDSHLQQLSHALIEVAHGGARSLFVHGLSGMGKSSLLEQFLRQVRGRGEAIVLEGRCYEQESVPFKALDTVIDSLAAQLAGLPPQALRDTLPADIAPLIRLFPVLGQLPRAAPNDRDLLANADQLELRQRALTALRDLLRRLAARLPLVIYIDDLQWGDEDSAVLLADLMRPPDPPRLLLLGAYRREDVEVSPCLLALQEAYRRGHQRPHRQLLPVDALVHGDATRLALELLGRQDAAAVRLADRVAQESSGSPFFVWELAQHVREEGSTDAVGSLELDEVIWSRVRRLPEETRRLLEVFAVAGRPIGSSEAFQAADQMRSGPSQLAQLRTGSFVRTRERGDETIVECYHDRIRESVVNHLANARVRGHNLKLALAIEQSSGLRPDEVQGHLAAATPFELPSDPPPLAPDQWQRVFDLADFFDAAGKPERALNYAVLGAEQAWSQNALELSERQFEIAARGAASSDDATRFRVAEGLGDLLLMRGRYDQAAGQFQLARSLAATSPILARIDGKLGSVAFKRGDMASAARHLEKGLAELGTPPPANRLALAAALTKESLIQALHTALPRWSTGRRPLGTPRAETDLARVRLYDSLCYPYWFTKGAAVTLWSHLRQMNLAERYPPTADLGRAYSIHAVIATALPLAGRGSRYADRSYAIHGQLGDRHGQGKARSFQTFACLALGRFREGAQAGLEAVELLEQAGDVWEANMARMIVSVSLYHQGDLRRGCQEARRAYEIGHETGDHSSMGMSLAFWLTNSPQAIPRGQLQLEIERPREDPLTSAVLLKGRGLELLLCEDQPQQAARMLDDSIQLARQRGLRNVYLFGAYTWRAQALRVVAQRSQGAARRPAIKAARRAAAQALRVTRNYRQCRAQALRERALVAVERGRARTAQRYFDASLRVACRQLARYEEAQTLRDRGAAGLRFSWPDAQQQYEQGAAAVSELEEFDA